MGRFDAGTAIALGGVGVVSIAVGTFGAVVGVPANYGMTTAQALSVLDHRPVLYTTLWVVWAVAMTLAAIWRARWLARHEPGVRDTAVRGSIWLWGAIGAPWIYPWIAWDLQLFDYFNESPPPGTSSPALTIGLWWWLGAGLALLVGVVWSSARHLPSGRTPIEPPADEPPPTTNTARSKR